MDRRLTTTNRDLGPQSTTLWLGMLDLLKVDMPRKAARAYCTTSISSPVPIRNGRGINFLSILEVCEPKCGEPIEIVQYFVHNDDYLPALSLRSPTHDDYNLSYRRPAVYNPRQTHTTLTANELKTASISWQRSASGFTRWFALDW